MNILLCIDMVQPWILQTIINHEGYEGHEGSVYVLDLIMLFFVPFVSFVVISRFMCSLYIQTAGNNTRLDRCVYYAYNKSI